SRPAQPTPQREGPSARLGLVFLPRLPRPASRRPRLQAQRLRGRRARTLRVRRARRRHRLGYFPSSCRKHACTSGYTPKAELAVTGWLTTGKPLASSPPTPAPDVLADVPVPDPSEPSAPSALSSGLSRPVK